jgi:hypothetical protein
VGVEQVFLLEVLEQVCVLVGVGLVCVLEDY